MSMTTLCECGHPQVSGNFCRSCGRPRAETPNCMSCGKALLSSLDQFCGECGAPQTQPEDAHA